MLSDSLRETLRHGTPALICVCVTENVLSLYFQFQSLRDRHSIPWIWIFQMIHPQRLFPCRYPGWTSDDPVSEKTEKRKWFGWLVDPDPVAHLATERSQVRSQGPHILIMQMMHKCKPISEIRHWLQQYTVVFAVVLPYCTLLLFVVNLKYTWQIPT